MADDKKKYEYIYSTEELDRIIQDIKNGISPMLSDQLSLEVQMRIKELKEELFEDDEEFDVDLIERHNEMMKQHIEEKRRQASRNDVVYINISEDKKKEIREDMEVSIVSPNPNDSYNKSDEEMYSSEEKKNVEMKLAKLKNCYYNQIDYVNAINIIKEAIDYSLRNDYPWMSYEDAVTAFNKGEIHFSFCRLPKLYINYQTQITDPEILRGVVTGEVTLKDRNDTSERKKVNKNQKGIPFEYNVISDNEFKHYLDLHHKGYDTPISTIVKSKSTLYNRFAMPTQFNNNNGKDNNQPLLFDWLVDNAGVNYFNQINNIKITTSQLIKQVNEDNSDMLSSVISMNASQFLSSMKYVYTPEQNKDIFATSFNVDPTAVQIEQNILSAIKSCNPTK